MRPHDKWKLEASKEGDVRTKKKKSIGPPIKVWGLSTNRMIVKWKIQVRKIYLNPSTNQKVAINV